MESVWKVGAVATMDSQGQDAILLGATTIVLGLMDFVLKENACANQAGLGDIVRTLSVRTQHVEETVCVTMAAAFVCQAGQVQTVPKRAVSMIVASMATASTISVFVTLDGAVMIVAL